MVDVLTKSLENLNIYEQKYINFFALSDTALLILNCFKERPEKNLQTNELVSLTKIPRRTVIYSLNSLVEKMFLQKLGQGAKVRYKLVF
jgi:DNA-binding IclR family transcriptional regulator